METTATAATGSEATAEQKQRNMEIATTICDQIGKATFFMLGTQHRTAIENGLSFNIRGQKKFTHIRVILEPSDTYRVEFLRIRKFDVRDRETVDDVYAEDLHEIIRQKTGLETRMPNIRFS